MTTSMTSERAVVFLLTSLAGAGSQRKTVTLTNALVRDGYNVHLCYLDRKEALLPSIEPSPNLRIDCLDRRGRLDGTAMTRFARLMESHPGGTLFAVNPYPVFFAARSLGKLRTRYRFVAATNTYTFANAKEAILFHLFQKRDYRNADLVLFGSIAQRKRWCGDYSMDAEKAAVIHNGVDVDHFSPDARVTPSRARRDGDAVVIVMIASFYAYKRHNDVLSAMKILLERGQEISAIFVGEGPMLPSLRKSIQGTGLEDRVVFTGFSDDVRPCLRSADISVLSSSAVETFSNAILESMAMGVPVIASDIGGAAEQIEHGVNGLLFEPGNVEELASCIQTLCDPERRRGAGIESRRIAVERFGLERMVEAYKSVLG